MLPNDPDQDTAAIAAGRERADRRGEGPHLPGHPKAACDTARGTHALRRDLGAGLVVLRMAHLNWAGLLVAGAFADFDVEALDLLVECGERDLEELGGLGLVPVTAL